MRVLAWTLLSTSLVIAGGAPAQPQRPPLEQALEQALAEQAAAETRVQKLEDAAEAARGEAARLRAEQAAAAEAIDAAEARITAAEAQYRLAAAYVAGHRQRLAQEQQPISSLLAGLALMAQRPPLLALATGSGSDDFVKIGILLDSTWPSIRRRTQALSSQLTEGQRLQEDARVARADLVRSRQLLNSRRAAFAALERRARAQMLAAGGEALGAGDVAIAASAEVERLQGEQSERTSADRLARFLLLEPASPARPFGPPAAEAAPTFAYALPVRAPVIQGLGDVSKSGVRARGTTFATARGAPVTAPAAGVVRFSGPFRDYDGIVIIDHGSGWLSLLVNLSSPLAVGDRVAAGDPVGRALGPLQVQLSRQGQRLSPALIAGSSPTLSKKG
jgi:septal ring factor EnvC (AmiA/AmiB activator)